MSEQARAWVWTYYPSADNDINDSGTGPLFQQEDMAYMCYGIEICPTTKRLHWQGFVIFTSRHRMSAVKTLLHSSTIHVERMRGTVQESIEYCRKDGNFQEWGTIPSGMKRSQLSNADILTTLRTKKVRDIISSTPELMYRARELLYIQNTIVNDTPKKWKTWIWFWTGVTGAGKTTRLINYSNILNKDFYFKHDNSKFWDGYNGQEIVVFDDVIYPISHLLRLHNPTPQLVNLKGGSINFRARIIIICTNYSIDEWYQSARGNPVQFEAFKRRILRTRVFDRSYYKSNTTHTTMYNSFVGKQQ